MLSVLLRIIFLHSSTPSRISHPPAPRERRIKRRHLGKPRLAQRRLVLFGREQVEMRRDARARLLRVFAPSRALLLFSAPLRLCVPKNREQVFPPAPARSASKTRGLFLSRPARASRLSRAGR